MSDDARGFWQSLGTLVFLTASVIVFLHIIHYT